MVRQEVRMHLLEKRNQLPETTRKACSKTISNRTFALFRPSDIAVGVYLRTGSEVDLATLINNLWLSDRKVYVPKIISKKIMQWNLFSSWDDCITGQFGIRTSRLQANIDLTCLDVVIMPCVGFDRQLNRIGMGGGFYDRALEGLGPQPLRVGVAFSVQESFAIEPEAWDIPFHRVITERETILP